MHVSFEKREVIGLAALLLLAFTIRVLLFPLPGYEKVDTQDFIVWFNTAAEHGPRTFYKLVWSDYPPLNVYFFWFFGSLAKALSLFGTSLIRYMVKLPPNLFDIATGFLIFAFVRKRLNYKMALLATALYVFNPAVIYNTAIWGQYDAIYTFFLVLSLMLALKSKPELSAVTFTLGVLTKPQSIALAPLIIYLILKKNGWRRSLTSLLAAVATVFVVIIPFEWTNPVVFLQNIYFGAYGGYAFTSVNAFNLWAIGGLWVPETQLSFLVGWTLFGALAVFTLYVLHKRLDRSGEMLVLFSAFILFFGFFMLPTRIHERYLFPAISILALTFPFFKKTQTRLIYVFLTITCFINQAYILYWLNATYPSAPNLTGDPVVFMVSLINLAVLMYALSLLWTEFKGQKLSQTSPSGPAEKTDAKVKVDETGN